MPVKNGAQNIKGGLEKYKIIFELSPEAVAITDEKGNILDMNGRVYDWLGYQPEEVIGKNIAEVPFLEKEARMLVRQNFAERVIGVLIPPYELNFFKKNGEIVVGRIMGSRILDDNKKLLGVIIMISDITDRKEMEEKIRASEEKMRLILSSIDDLIFILNTDGFFTEYYQPFQRKDLYVPASEFIGKNIRDVMPPDVVEATQKAIKEIELSGKAQQFDYWIAIKDHKLAYNARLSPIKNKSGRLTGIVVVVRDITERKKIEQSKTEFVSIASHQLRTPLTTVNWYTEMLLDKKTGKINAKQKEYLKEIYDATQQLIKLASLLLDVSRIELGTFKVSLKPVNLMEAANKSIESLKAEIAEKDLKIKKNYDKAPIVINGDSNVLNIVFQNLISNATRYTPKGGLVEISIKKQKSDVLLKVSDTGYGIPKSQQSQIFTKFFRADNIREKETAGSGLGLYIVKSLLEHCSCKIWFESPARQSPDGSKRLVVGNEGKGTTFFVSIPLPGIEIKNNKNAKRKSQK